jgi:hypothetical protein
MLRFAERYPTKKEATNAIGTYPSWYRMVKNGLTAAMTVVLDVERVCHLCGELVEPAHLVAVRLPEGEAFVLHRTCCLQAAPTQATPALRACLAATRGPLVLVFEAAGDLRVLAQALVPTIDA